tara:strand:+ start:2006 stop:2971 length:966 start_codon:yes stop_codon:yes gene_type:complete
MTVTKNKLISMLQYMRPAYSYTEKMFCDKYILPVFGEPDAHGNYTKVIGSRPNIAFTAHTDTVHKQEGIQTITIEDDFATTMTGSCLGADCTTGLWLMLGMIEAGVEGVYVAHAAEEIGGLGSTALVRDRPVWLNEIDAVISFDRFGTDSIITHQGGSRTASDEFALSLAIALDMSNLNADKYGTYTDSVEYADLIPECTNLSVGYYNQHTSQESQDLRFAEVLLERLIQADWCTLAIIRNPEDQERASYTDSYSPYYNYETTDDRVQVESLERLLVDRPGEIADFLFEQGYTLDGFVDELRLDNSERDFYMDVPCLKTYY